MYGLLVIAAVVSIVSAIIYLAPVDPTRLTFGQRSDDATIESKRKALGLDQSLPTQLLYYFRDISPIAIISDDLQSTGHYTGYRLAHFSNGDLMIKKPYLRESFQSGKNVANLLFEAFPKTFYLSLFAILLASIIGIFLGVIGAIYKDSWVDDMVVSLSVLGYSLPSYVSAIILAVIFGFILRQFTGLNVQGSIYELNDLGDEVVVWKNIILPAIALGIRPIAVTTQLTRSTMLDVLSQGYIRTAIAKGLSKPIVIIKHGLRNALNPIITALSGWFASLLAGAFFVESVFNFKGLGQLTITALLNYDIPVVLACIIFVCIIFVVINILVDIMYYIIDPKVQL